MKASRKSTSEAASRSQPSQDGVKGVAQADGVIGKDDTTVTVAADVADADPAGLPTAPARPSPATAVPGAFTLVGLMAMAVAGHKANLWTMSRVALVATAVLVAQL